MQKKFITTYILIGVLLVLGAIIYFLKYTPAKENQIAPQVAFYQNFTKDNITKVEIVKAGKILTLQKDNDKWLEKKEGMADQEADTAQVDTLFSKLSDIKVGEPITQTEDKKALFQVDGSNVQIKMYNNDQEAINFYLGKSTADFNGNYLRKEDENKIYSSNERITFYFDKTTFVKTDTNTNQ